MSGTSQGFLPPYTESGRSALVPEMPWHYSGTLLTVEYLTDPKNVRAILPAELELADEHPGAVALIWADWQSCSTGGEELLDPAKATAVCEKCSDERKNQPVAGMTIIKGVKQSADDKDLFDGGEILNPKR